MMAINFHIYFIIYFYYLFLIYLSVNGNIYTCGHGSRLGLGDDSQGKLSPTKVDISQFGKIILFPNYLRNVNNYFYFYYFYFIFYYYFFFIFNFYYFFV